MTSEDIYNGYIYIYFFAHFHFPASGQAVVTGVIPSSPRFLPSIFISHRVQQIPLLVDGSSSVANSRSRAFRKSICPQEKVPTNIYEYALGGARTHETDLYQARGYPDTPPGRPVYYILNWCSDDIGHSLSRGAPSIRNMLGKENTRLFADHDSAHGSGPSGFSKTRGSF